MASLSLTNSTRRAGIVYKLKLVIFTFNTCCNVDLALLCLMALCVMEKFPNVLFLSHFSYTPPPIKPLITHTFPEVLKKTGTHSSITLTAAPMLYSISPE